MQVLVSFSNMNTTTYKYLDARTLKLTSEAWVNGDPQKGKNKSFSHSAWLETAVEEYKKNVKRQSYATAPEGQASELLK